jgi:hypothetical protein
MSTHKDSAKDRKILDQVRDVMRLHHYSFHTERTYCDWITRYIQYHNMTSRQDLIDGEAKIEAFLTHLAVDKDVAPSTQNHEHLGRLLSCSNGQGIREFITSR